MDYLSATRTVQDNVCAVCGGLLGYRIEKDGEYAIFCPGHPEHTGYWRPPTNRDVWAESFRRQAEIMESIDQALKNLKKA